MNEGHLDRPSLTKIGLAHGTDKVEHGYLEFYADLFAHLRDRPIRLLEIGVGGFDKQDDPGFGGHSLRMWREHFRDGSFVGLDILDKSAVASDRITIVRGSQIDDQLLRRVSRDHGPFDIVIDDGSHVPAHARHTFAVLFPLLAPNGIYCIEDIQTSYWPLWGGQFGREGRRGTMRLVKERLDGLNHAEFKLPNYRPSALDLSIVEVRARHNLVAFIKGDNSQPSTLNRPHPTPYREWVRSEAVPTLMNRCRTPRVLSVLDGLGLRTAAGTLRRWVTLELD